MYSDLLFNFTKMTQDSDSDFAAQVLTEMATSKPFFALDTGIKADDLWNRVDLIRETIELINDDNAKRIANQMMYFSAGIMGDLDSVENRYEYIETLEDTITSFKDSDDEYSNRIVAIGPCGIDHDWDSVEYEGREHDYFDNSTIDDERNLLAMQLILGKKLNLPIILHSRKGFKDTIDVLKTVKWNKGVIHGFSYTQAELEFFLDLGWYVSFNGTVTYSGKKAAQDMADIVSYVPKDRILIESDSPYYAPVPLKNTINTPNNMHYLYEYIASKRNVSTAKLSAAVDDNFKKLFL